MASLYEIIRDIENFEFQIDDETGEILNIEELDKLELEKDTKTENICLFIKNLKADIEAYKGEKKTFDQKIKQAENKVESLTKYLQNMLGGEKFKTSKVSVSYKKSEKVVCPDMLLVEPDYLRYVSPELDKKKIKDAIKAGVEVKGCYIEESSNIQIK